VQEETVKKRLERYESLLRDKGIDPDKIFVTLDVKNHTKEARSEAEGIVSQLPTPASMVSEPRATIFKPQLLHGQGGTKLVDK
jgi:hypothetical protein